MHNFPWFWLLFAMFWMFFWKAGQFRFCEGRWSGESGAVDANDRPQRRRGRRDLESALAERDALIAKLEERVRVLERIATDDSARLRAEIDALRDPPPERS